MTVVIPPAELARSSIASLLEGREHGVGHMAVLPAETPQRFENTGDGRLDLISVEPSGVVVQTVLDA